MVENLTRLQHKKTSVLVQHPEIRLQKSTIFNESLPSLMRKTKIICTLGPSSWKVENLVQLLEAGMNIARLNFSHGDHGGHRNVLKNLREALKQTPNKSCGIMLDTKGPEIRTGYMQDPKGAQLKTGQDLEISKLSLISLATDYSYEGNSQKIAISYPAIVKVPVGSRILIADGNLCCEVKEIRESSVIVKVLNDFVLTNTKNVNLPNIKVELPTLTEKDEDDLINFGLKEGIDFIAASFVRTAEDIENIRDVLGPRGSHIKIIAKIENHEGLENYEEILEAADGIMVARGDLGMELPVEKVFIAQKFMIDKANILAKPIITATQMLESMIKNPRPTRAEATDVANAVLDGTDCVMLSGETASGGYPVEAVTIMSKICIEAETCVNSKNVFDSIVQNLEKPISVEESICMSAVETAYYVDAAMIVILTETGTTVRNIAKYKPRCPILALCMSSSVIRQLNLTRGVITLKIPSNLNQENLIHNACLFAEEKGYLKKDDKVVKILAQNEDKPDAVNVMKVATVK